VRFENGMWRCLRKIAANKAKTLRSPKKLERLGPVIFDRPKLTLGFYSRVNRGTEYHANLRVGSHGGFAAKVGGAPAIICWPFGGAHPLGLVGGYH
jgi:hypothetical protein